MGMGSEDREIIYNAYLEFRNCCEKKGSKMNPPKAISYHAQTITQAERYIYYLENSSLLEAERKNIVEKGKRLFRQYCMQCRCQPEIREPRTDQKLEQLLLLIAAYEAERLERLKLREGEERDYDIGAMLSEPRYYKYVMANSIENTIACYAKEHGGPVWRSGPYFMTRTGAKYHLKNCPYCSGKTMIPASQSDISGNSLLPCRCVEDRERKVAAGSETPAAPSGAEHNKTAPSITEQKNTMTAFIDETIRPNALHAWSKRLPEETAMYSYIICRGHLKSESQITSKNRVGSGIGLVTGPDKRGVERIAMEAISQVLLKIAGELDFFGNVIIYTDNLSAQKQWSGKPLSRKIGTMFQKVSVFHVMREKNKAADQLGRRMSILELPVDLMDSLARLTKENLELRDYKRKLEPYFPNPGINMENLIEELENLTFEIKKLRKGTRGAENPPCDSEGSCV